MPLRDRFIRTLLVAAVALSTAGGAPAQASAQEAQTSASARAPGGPAATTQGTQRPLLIGINNYKAVPHLMGSLNDVAAMKQILLTRWGFPEQNIRTLIDEQATRAAILAAMRDIVRDSGPNDTVLIHYSGHGSQVQDLNGDEDDGL